MERGKFPEIPEATMPLHAVTEVFGTKGLLNRFDYEVGKFPGFEQQQINQAFLLANSLHKNDRRVREPYINHILRVSTRIMSHYKVADADVVAASLLHDSVEDHANELSDQSPNSARASALNNIGKMFSYRVGSLVAGVTNPDFDEQYDKGKQYLDHLANITKSEDPNILIIKLSDFTDNATGLVYTTGWKVPKLAGKYLPVIPVLRKGLERPDLPLLPEVVEHISQQLDLTESRLRSLH